MSTVAAAGDDSQSEIKKLPPNVAMSACFHLIALTLLFCCSVGGGFGFGYTSGLDCNDHFYESDEEREKERSLCLRVKIAAVATVIAFLLYFFTFLLMLVRMIMFMVPCEFGCKNDRTAKIMDLTVTIASGVAFGLTCVAYFVFWGGFSQLYTIVLTAGAFGFSGAGLMIDRRNR
ncbi:hypothetical protein M3Y94_00895800 [Aphelenchoides besseyi]|nr:hypothetical protein M3Y94_00895800 [Aphelenchoides besseyi]KAI6223400.1 hypothetical protein M3Y95_00886100 [Aphelenchoides besseyi]